MENRKKEFFNYLDSCKESIKRGDLDGAFRYISKALAIDSKNEHAVFELGKIFHIKCDYGRAISEYKKAIGINPDFDLPRLEMGKVLLIRGVADSAEKQFKHLMLKNSDIEIKLESLYELAKIYRLYKDESSFDDIRSILKEFSKNLIIKKENIKYAQEAAKLYRMLGERKMAENILKELLQLQEVYKDKFLNNKILNELELTQQKEVLESKVRSMVAMIIDKCNLRCKICEIWKSSWQISERTLCELIELFPYMEDINWEGGEVFLMRGFEDVLLEAAKYKNLRQIIYTNGLMINERILDKMSNARADIVFSIDGVSNFTYESIRCGGKFDRLRKVLALVKEFRKPRKKDIKIYLNPIIMRTNYKELTGFIEFAKEFEFDAVTFNPIRGEFGDENIFEMNDEVALKYIERVMPSVLNKSKEYGIRLNNWLPVEYCEPCEEEDSQKDDQVREENSGSRNNDLICYAPWQRMVLDSGGMIRPHVFCLDKWVGCTKDETLAQIWNGEGMQLYRRSIASADYSELCQPECISGQVRDNTRDIE